MAIQTKDPQGLEEENVVLASTQGGSQGQQDALQVTEDARDKEYRQPSFGAKLFMGDFDSSLLFPFPTQSAEDKKVGDVFIAQLEAFLVENLDPDEVDKTYTIPDKVIQGLGKMGVFAMKIPKEYGGLGFSQTNYCRAVMKVASYCGATAVLISAHQSIGVPQPLLMYGTKEQKERFFPRFRNGEISAFALTEVDAGSDPAQMSSKAVLSDDGSHYILTGTKLWCTNGTIANVIVVMAQTAAKTVRGKERKQISAFIVDMKTPGVEVLHRCEFMGLHGIYNGVIKFTNVKIPKENLLWEEGRGLAMALGTINVGRLTLPAACAGVGKQCLSIARRWGNERVQWGMPVGRHEAGKDKISYIAATTLAIEAITWLTCRWADEKRVDIRIEAAMGKLFCTEATWKITDMTMQLRGGRGYESARSLKARGEPPYPVERAMRDVRINTILEGSSEIMRLFLAREAMDPHLQRLSGLLSKKASVGAKIKTALGLVGHYSWWYPAQLVKSLFSSSYSELGPLAAQFKFIEKTSHQLAGSIFYYMAVYQQGLEKRQLLVGHLMEIGTELFAMAATCSYAHSLWNNNKDDQSAIELAKHFCLLSRRRIAGHFDALSDNDDRSGNKVADRVLNGDCRWLEQGIVWIGPKDL